jgi:hypothetical protein
LGNLSIILFAKIDLDNLATCQDYFRHRFLTMFGVTESIETLEAQAGMMHAPVDICPTTFASLGGTGMLDVYLGWQSTQTTVLDNLAAVSRNDVGQSCPL